MMLMIFEKHFWLGKLEIAYENTIIRKIKPKLVITFIDNNSRFYNISRVQKGVKTVAIQNGWRYGWDRDVFSTFKTNQDFYVDYMMVFGELVANEYQKYLGGKTIVMGSLSSSHLG